MAFDRQRLTNESKKALDDSTKASSLGDTTVYLKDLGPQISWRTVFLIEYVRDCFAVLGTGPHLPLDNTARPASHPPHVIPLPTNLHLLHQQNLRSLQFATVSSQLPYLGLWI